MTLRQYFQAVAHRANMVLGGTVIAVLALVALENFGTFQVANWLLIAICLAGGAYFVVAMYYVVRCPRCSYGLGHFVNDPAPAQSVDDARACPKCGLSLNSSYEP